MPNLNRLLTALLLLTPLAGAQDVRDPTTPLASGVAGSVNEEPRLQSILRRASDKLAIINGEPVREGDSLPALAGAVVEKINADHVLLRREDTRELLYIYYTYQTVRP